MSMNLKRIILVILFLAPPILILSLALARRGPAYHGVSAQAWFEAAQAGQPSAAVTALQHIGPPAVPLLQAQLKTGDTDAKVKAAWLQGQLGAPASNAIPDLIAALDDPNQGNLPIICLQSLASIAPGQIQAIPRLLALLRDPHPGVSNCAADLLHKIEQARQAAHEPMPVDDLEYAQAFLSASTQRVRLMGLAKLVQLPRTNAQVRAVAESLRQDTNAVIRSQAEQFLYRPAPPNRGGFRVTFPGGGGS